MGARGPLAMPDNVRQLRGNPGKRKTKPTPKAVAAIPSPPTWLAKEAKAEWRRVTPELHRLGVLARIDRGVLSAYCQFWARFVEADRQLACGLTIMTERGRVKNPAWQVYRDAATMVASLAKELGVSPNARLRMRAPEHDDDPDADLD